MHSTCKSGESCISFKEINFLHSWGKKGAVIYLDFINCGNKLDNAHTLVTSKYSLQEVTGALYLPVPVDTYIFKGFIISVK